MNRLADSAYRVIRGKKASREGLSKIEQAAMEDSQPLLCRSLDELDTWLTLDQAPPEEWLIPPATISLQFHS